MKHRIWMLAALWSCSGSVAPHATEVADAASDVVPTPCPSSAPSAEFHESCFGNTECHYGLPVEDAGQLPPNSSPQERCDCIAPENEWLCCRWDQIFQCPPVPPLMEGQPCCPGDAENHVGATTTGCDQCFDDGTVHKCMCSTEDRHWRCEATTSPDCLPKHGN
jgi:hypothetical protein